MMSFTRMKEAIKEIPESSFLSPVFNKLTCRMKHVVVITVRPQVVIQQNCIASDDST